MIMPQATRRLSRFEIRMQREFAAVPTDTVRWMFCLLDGDHARAYLYGSATRDPFTRAAIKAKQPEVFAWLEKEFGPM